jgi:hypothetical protein
LSEAKDPVPEGDLGQNGVASPVQTPLRCNSPLSRGKLSSCKTKIHLINLWMGKLPLDKGLAAQADWGFKSDATPTQNPQIPPTKIFPNL